MIRQLFALTNPRGRALLKRLIAWTIATAIVQGLAFVALVPLLAALLGGDTAGAGRWLAVLGGLALAFAAAFWAANQAGNAAATDVLASLFDRLGDRVVELPLGWFGQDRSGELADLATRGIVFASAAPYAIVRPILTAFLTPATVLVGALAIDWRIAAAMAVPAPVMWVIYRWHTARFAVADKEHAEQVAEASARLIEFARVQPALRAAGDNAITRRLVVDALDQQHEADRHSHVAGGAGIGVFGGVVQLAVVGVSAVGTWLALGGELGIAEMVSLLVLAVRFTEPITQAGGFGAGVSIARNTLERIRDLLDEPALDEPATPARPGGFTIRFDRVTFGYGGAPVLRDLSFEALAGGMTAIVGPSGSGKTTITRLIARFYDPQSGTVSIGGVPLPELGSTQVSSAVSPVFQDVYLFDGTIAENIWLGNPSATREQVVAAGRRARVDEIAGRLAGGWDARVGEGGTSLSGGERQRVSIARALLKDAPIVLLDEATAALDVGNERAVHEAFDAIRAGRTLVVVAHRLQTIASADRIIMLDASGAIAEQGSHDELLAREGTYARYWASRVQAGGWRLTNQARGYESRGRQ